MDYQLWVPGQLAASWLHLSRAMSLFPQGKCKVLRDVAGILACFARILSQCADTQPMRGASEVACNERRRGKF